MSGKEKKGGRGVVRVGVDDGHYGIKLAIEPGVLTHHPVSGEPVGDGEIVEVYLASRLVDGQAFAGEDDGTNCYKVGERVYTVVGDANVGKSSMDTRVVDYPTSPMNKVLVHHALYMAGLGGMDVSLVTGLPVNRYYNPATGKPNIDYIKAKTDFLLNDPPVNLNGSVQLANIVAHRVMSEAVAGYFDALIRVVGGKGVIDEEFDAMVEDMPVTVVDIGGNTTDTATLLAGGSSIDRERSFSLENGGLHIEQRVEHGIRHKCAIDPATVIAKPVLEKAIMQRSIRLLGKSVDLGDLIGSELAIEADKIRNGLRARIQGAETSAVVLLIGGGAEMLREYATQWFAHGQIPAGPRHANARGMLKAHYMAD